MKAGIHKECFIVGCFTGESREKKTPYFGIEFSNQEGETIEHAFYLTDATKEKNIETLVSLGFKGKSLADLSNPKLKISDLFGEPEDKISLTIEDESYTNSEGEEKVKQVVKWVNVGNKGGLSKVDHATAVKIFRSTSFDGLLMQKKQGKPTPKPKETIKPSQENTDFANDDIPF